MGGWEGKLGKSTPGLISLNPLNSGLTWGGGSLGGNSNVNRASWDQGKRPLQPGESSTLA